MRRKLASGASAAAVALMVTLWAYGCSQPASAPAPSVGAAEPTATRVLIAAPGGTTPDEQPPRTAHTPTNMRTHTPAQMPPENVAPTTGPTAEPTAAPTREPTATPTIEATDTPPGSTPTEPENTPATPDGNQEPEAGLGTDSSGGVTTGFIDSLSPADKACLPEQATSDEAVRLLVEQGGEDALGTLMDCLSADAQFQLYMMGAIYEHGEAGELTVEEHQCIWDGMQALTLTGYEGTGDENADETIGRLFVTALLGPVVVMAYCVDIERLAEEDVSAEEIAEMRWLRCVIDAAGSPDEFLALVTNSSEDGDPIDGAFATECGPKPPD